jgi:hypothetical protein
MNSTRTLTDQKFQAGENVVLAKGPYQGTSGVFLRLTRDETWAEIEERGSRGSNHPARSHPVIWLERADD